MAERILSSSTIIRIPVILSDSKISTHLIFLDTRLSSTRRDVNRMSPNVKTVASRVIILTGFTLLRTVGRMTREEIEKRMDELAREYVETRDPKIIEELYELALELRKMLKESSD
jgi:hypothetical protein